MSWLLRIRSTARQDIDEGADWYEEQRPGLGEEFLSEVERWLLRIEEAPERFSTRYGEVRRVNLDRFPYGIFYWIPDARTIEVLAVLHGARAPRRWPAP